MTAATDSTETLRQRLTAYDWPQSLRALEDDGYACFPGLLTPEQCSELIALYEQSALFRSRIIMSRHSYGRGEYQYFADPLPPLVEALREHLYAMLAPCANTWAERLRSERRFPSTLAELRSACAALGQTRPTPLLLKYGAGDYNRLHQDLYGELVFPLQLAILLSVPGRDFTGGELVLTEQRARTQSRVEVVPLSQGDAVLFPVADRPVTGTRGDYRVKMRHGVSRVRSGSRLTLGIIFHDAK